MTTQRIALVGAGLAGCECALQLARRGFAVTLFEQKPEAYSPAHSMPQLAELVCSNSLRSDELASGVGLIKQELRELGSALMAVADATRVPAGKALAVDRELFAGKVTELVEAEPNITLVRKAIADLDDPALEGFERVVISAGPLASESLSASIARAVGAEHLYFYDAIAPIVAADSIDMGIAFWGSRYGEPGEGDYLNCPMDEDEYKAFYQGLLALSEFGLTAHQIAGFAVGVFGPQLQNGPRAAVRARINKTHGLERPKGQGAGAAFGKGLDGHAALKVLFLLKFVG